MAKQHEKSLAGYVTKLSQHLGKALPQALDIKGERAVHQARVTTRRLGSAIDLVQSWLPKSRLKDIHENLRRLRRALARLRDTDVMLARLEQYRAQHPLAVHWLELQLQELRRKALKKLSRERSLPSSTQWRNRQLLDALSTPQPRIRRVLNAAIRGNFGEFCKTADLLTDAQPSTHCTIDVHALRINGKRARYTLEVAAELGAPLPKQVGRQFKQIQDMLGAWHDYVVLAQRATKLAAGEELAIDDTALFDAVLKLVSAITADASAAIQAFKDSWKQMREEISPAVRQLSSNGPGKRLRT